MKIIDQETCTVDVAKDFAPIDQKKVRRVSFEKTLPQQGLSLNNLGNNHFRNGNYKDAMENYQEALKIFTETYKEQHVDIANTLGNIGNTYWRIGDMEQAATCLESSLHVHRLISSVKNEDFEADDTVEIANTLHSLGIVYYLQGNNNRALEVFDKALKSRESVFGFDSIDVARTLDAIGSVNLQKGYNKDAIQYFRESLCIKRALLGTNHPSIVLTMKHLANAYRSKLDYCKALDLYEEVLNSQTIDDFSCFTEKDIGETLQLIGEIYMQRMQHSYAIPYFKNALSKFEKAGVKEGDIVRTQLVTYLNAAMNVTGIRC